MTTPESRTALGRRTRNAERAAATAVHVAAREVDRRLELERRIEYLAGCIVELQRQCFELEHALGRRARRRLARIRRGRAQ